MKNLLMIAYDFPPEGHAGVYRPLRFVRHLASLGWSSTVISAGGTQFQRYDPNLLTEVPAETEVVRPVKTDDVWQSIQRRRAQRLLSGSRPTSAGNGEQNGSDHHGRVRSIVRALVRRAESCWYDPDMEMHWIRPAVDAAVQVCSRRRPEVIWATGPPFSSFLVAGSASQRTGVPYVLDFRTSWTIVPSAFEEMRPRWAQKRDRRRLRQLFTSAHAVTFFYAAEAECFWRRYAGALDASRIHIIPNGFDGSVEEPVLPPTTKFTMLYTGTLSDYRHDTFLNALALFKKRDPARSLRLSVQFIGEEEPSLMKGIEEWGLSDVVSTCRPVPHAEIIERQRSAHALLMLERKPTHKGYELLAGAKLFGYLKAGRPILGVVPRGEAERVLRDVSVSTIADPDSPEAICSVLETLFGAWCVGSLPSFVPDRAACERYSGKQQTEALARALEGLPPLKPFIPGVVDIAPSLKADIADKSWI